MGGSYQESGWQRLVCILLLKTGNPDLVGLLWFSGAGLRKTVDSNLKQMERTYANIFTWRSKLTSLGVIVKKMPFIFVCYQIEIQNANK